MRKKVVFLCFLVFMLSFLPTSMFVASTPGAAAAENTVRTILPVNTENPTPLSPLATPIRNLWGAAAGEKVDLELQHSDKVVSWSWSRQNPVRRPGVDYIQPIYPNARIVLKSPVAVSDIQSFILVAGFNYTQPPTGSYNLAYDIFLREKGTAIDNRKSEIMIWLDGTQKQPTRYLTGLCSDGNYNYTRYSWTNSNSFDYHSFLLDLPPSSTTRQINLKALIDLVKPENDWYISEVELGTEVWQGSGALELNTYYLELNGIRL